MIESQVDDGRQVTIASSWEIELSIPDEQQYERGMWTPPFSIEIDNDQDTAIYWRMRGSDIDKAMRVGAGVVDTVSMHPTSSSITIFITAKTDPSSGVVYVRGG